MFSDASWVPAPPPFSSRFESRYGHNQASFYNPSEGVEQDLLLLHLDDWPIDKSVVDREIGYNPISHSGQAARFRFTYLVSQNGELLQQAQNGFGLSGWAANRFPREASDTRTLQKFREGDDNPFSRFLPKNTRLDQYLVRELVTQIRDYMYKQT